MAFDGLIIYQVADDLGFENLSRVARRAGVMSILQVTAYYSGRRVRHSVAQVIEYQLGEVQMQLVYEGFNRHKPLQLTVPKARLEKLVRALRQAKFDTLQDQDGLTFTDRSLWLIQRAAGNAIDLQPRRCRRAGQAANALVVDRQCYRRLPAASHPRSATEKLRRTIGLA